MRAVINRDGFFRRLDFYSEIQRQRADNLEKNVIALACKIFPEIETGKEISLVICDSSSVLHKSGEIVKLSERYFQGKYLFKMVCNYFVYDEKIILYVLEKEIGGVMCLFWIEEEIEEKE